MMACLYLELRLKLMLLMYSIKTNIITVLDIATSEFKEVSYALYCPQLIHQKLDNLLQHWQPRNQLSRPSQDDI